MFACAGACTADLSAACPDGWTSAGGQCAAPADYEGPCAPSLDFGSSGPQQKKNAAATCEFVWPCRG